MADNVRRYETNGAAAYQVYTLPEYQNYQDNTARQPVRRELPQEQRVPQQERRVRAKTAVAPFTVVGMLAVMCMLVLVIFGYVQLYEASTDVSALKQELFALQGEQVQLQARYDSKLDMNALEAKAMELGLSAPREEQIVYVCLTGTDRAVILEPEKTSVIGEIFSALEESISDLIEYLRPAEA